MNNALFQQILVLLRRDPWFVVLTGSLVLAALVVFVAMLQMPEQRKGGMVASVFFFGIASAAVWYWMFDRLRTLSAPEAVALLPGHRQLIRRQLRLQFVLWMLLPVLCVGVFVSGSAMLASAALLWPVVAACAYFGRDPRYLMWVTILVVLVMVTVSQQIKHMALMLNPWTHVVVASCGLLGWLWVLRLLSEKPLVQQSHFWRELRRLEQRGEAALRGQFHPDNSLGLLNRYEQQWSQRRRPAPGTPNNADQALAQLRWLLGPALRRKSPLNDAMGVLSVAVVILVILWTNNQADQTLAMLVALLGLAGGLAVHCWSMIGALRGSRTEQQVFRLLPGSGSAAHSDQLVRRLLPTLQRESAVWMVVLAAVVLVLAGVPLLWMSLMALQLAGLAILNLRICIWRLHAGGETNLLESLHLAVPNVLLAGLMFIAFNIGALWLAVPMALAPLVLLALLRTKGLDRAPLRLPLPGRAC